MKVKGSFDPNEGVDVITDVLVVPHRVTVSATGEELPFDLEMEVVLRKGRMVARSISAVGDGLLTGAALRRIPVAAILRLGVADALQLSALAGSDPVAVGRKGPTDEALRMVAAVYRIAYLISEPPTKAVAHTFEVPRSTAGRWVQMAREKEFLGPATQRKAG